MKFPVSPATIKRVYESLTKVESMAPPFPEFTIHVEGADIKIHGEEITVYIEEK